MGTEYKVYVGAFLQIDVPEKERIRNFRGCGNDDCDRKDLMQGGNFCNACGKKIETRHKIVKEHPHFREFLPSKFEDSFFGWQFWKHDEKNSQWVLMPNLSTLSKMGFFLDSQDLMMTAEIPDRDFAEQEFQSMYKEEIGYLMANGCSVELKYGIIHFWY